ncbi:hypothetical protein CAEBREN_24650 [Caenorhabditis brenneri]|uniref:DUF38 domain-containing protein n=1 Tax=Caenorhabditis brenneri TaxID=135651 RepID=G0PN17_CAEBE|nr:hypothetical protein CAEBREN_24650 [Caenorhabditis brenneri]
MVTSCQVDNIAKTEQWMKLKELKVDTRHEFNIDRISHLEKVQIKVKRLSGEAISQLIQNFITRNPRRGSFFSVSTWLPIVNSRILLSTILERFPAPRENENGFDGHLHTQKISMANPNNVFIVVLSPNNIFSHSVMSLPLPIWQHLPLHFKKDVVSNLDIRSRCCLRVCSSAEKGLVDSCSSRIDFLGINLTQPHFNSPHCPETPAKIFIKAKDDAFSKYFNIYDAVEQLLSIFSNDRVAVDTFHFHVCLLERNGNGFKFFNSFMNRLQTRNITIKVRRLELLTSFRDKYQFVNFVKYLDDDHIQSIKLYRAFKYYMDDIVTTDQWMNLKEFEFKTRNEFNIDWITHLYKLRLEIKRLSGEAISELIQACFTKYSCSLMILFFRIL